MRDAFDLAQSDALLPQEWSKRAEDVGRAKSQTNVAMLGTALLARATDGDVDVMALKASSGPLAYSARGLCHGVLVPLSVELRFSLGRTGREPLNNQPFFGNDRLDRVERPKYPEEFALLADIVREAGALSQDQAFLALAAFLRCRVALAAEAAPLSITPPSDLRLGRLLAGATAFVREDAEGGRRAQALTAAVYDLGHSAVEMRRVNDPSRGRPGDVVVKSAGRLILSVEVRSKAVSATEVQRFAEDCSSAGILQCVMVALAPGQEPFAGNLFWPSAWDDWGVVVDVVTSVEALLLPALRASDDPLEDTLAKLYRRVQERLVEIEAQPSTVERWRQLTTDPR